jgi:uridine kinase
MAKKPYLVGIVGASASGKTSFLRDLVARLPPSSCSVVSLDNYYHPIELQERDANGWANFDLPTALDRQRFHADLAMLLRGEKIVQREYTFNHREKSGALITIAPADVLILEGLFLFHDDDIRAALDLRVFIDADEEICRQRRVQRDQRERAYTLKHSAYCWEHHVLPAYRQYVLPYREEAHLIVANHTIYTEGLDALCQRLRGIIDACMTTVPDPQA